MSVTKIWDTLEKKILCVPTKHIDNERFVHDYELIYFKCKMEDRHINMDKNPQLLEGVK